MKRAICVWMVVLLCGAVQHARADVVMGQLNDFEDGTEQGWVGGALRTNRPDGGPAGAGDNFLELTSFNRLAMFNVDAAWTGDYEAAGVTAIRAAMRTTHSGPLSMRLVLFGAGSTNNRWTTTDPAILPNDGQWHDLLFPVTESGLSNISLIAGAAYHDVITAVDRILFRHQEGPPAQGGTPIDATVDIDDIRAVPEPASLVLLALGALMGRRRCRRSGPPDRR